MSNRKTLLWFIWLAVIIRITIPSCTSIEEKEAQAKTDAQPEPEPEPEPEVDFNAAARTFEEHVKKYLATNGIDQKETINRDEFIALFMNVTSSSKQTIQGQEENFMLLANKLADKSEMPIKVKDIPSLLNLNEMVFLYSEIVEEHNITFEDPNDNFTKPNNAEILNKIKEDL